MPRILSPAGDLESLYAALDAGADEVYFGLWGHNARAGARNFTKETAGEALRACKLRGVSSNITLNTLVSDREIPEALDLAYEALSMGADAFIVQDLGLAATLKKTFPEITLHASTQCACHSVSGARALMELGFERVVLARELDREEIAAIAALGCETEVFVHGALCVCHSGLCLMSSVIGKRSGNRGECAQPCRLPFRTDGETNGNGYALSLKDLSLAQHIPELCDLGITSLKIEGRMKPPVYVDGVTRVFKSLVSEKRGATNEEMTYLDALFSRSGFTDGYFTGAYRQNNRTMYGIRTEADKKKQPTSLLSDDICRRKVAMHASFAKDAPPTLRITCMDDASLSVTVAADFIAQAAQNAPTDKETVRTSLTKLGGTAFVCDSIDVSMSDALFLPKSQLNALRRLAVEALESKIMAFPKPEAPRKDIPVYNSANHVNRKQVYQSKPALRLYPHDKESLLKMLDAYAGYSIESVTLPLGLFEKLPPNDTLYAVLEVFKEKSIPFGVRMPRIVFTVEEPYAMTALRNAKSLGASYAQAENIGDIALIGASGLTVYAGASLNVYNSETLAVLSSLGVTDAVLSPELLSAQMRDIVRPYGMTTSLIGAGRLELMVLESCVVRAGSTCTHTENGGICSVLTDRMNARFSIRAEHRLGDAPYPCRNVILNSVPLGLLNKPEEIVKAGVEFVEAFQ